MKNDLSKDNLFSHVSTLKSSVLGNLNGRLFHKLNNMMCVITTNIEFIAMKKYKSSTLDEIIRDIRQSLGDYVAVIESFAILVKDTGDEKRGGSISDYLRKLNNLIAAGVVENVRLNIFENGIVYYPIYQIMNVLFVILSLAQNVNEPDGKKDETLEVVAEINKEGLRLLFKGNKIKDLPKNFVKDHNSGNIEDFRWFLFSELLTFIKAQLKEEKSGEESEVLSIIIKPEVFESGKKT